MKRSNCVFLYPAILACTLVIWSFLNTACSAADMEQWKMLVKADSLAMAQLKAGNFAEAEKQFDAMLKKNLHFNNAYWGLAACHYYQGNLEKMMSVAEKCFTNADSSNAKCWASFLVALAQYQKDDINGAKTSLNKAYGFAKETDDVKLQENCLNWQYMFLRDIGDIEASDKILDEEIEFAKTHNYTEKDEYAFMTGLLWNKANSAVLKGDIDEAKRCEKEYLLLKHETDPRESLGYKKIKAAIAFGEGRYGELIDLYKDRNTLTGNKRIALAYEKMGDKEKAKEYWTKVLNWNGRGFTTLTLHRQAKEKLAAI